MSAATPATSTPTPKGDNVKYLVVGIDNKTGSINYITDDSDKIIDSAKDTTPYDVLEDSIEPSDTNDVKFVKIKVLKSLTQPISQSTNKQPYFELNKAWYTLILDAPVDPRETSGVVTSKWFGDYVLEQDPFSVFKRFYNSDLVIKNLKYLFNLPSGESTFNEVFPEINQSKNGSFDEIKNALIRPFFAIKTVLDMGLKRDAKSLDNPNQTILVPGYFINGRSRYGYPNINGDKSSLITALQMLYDVRLISPDCIKTFGGYIITKMHAHIKFRNYFLRKNESPENIGDFDTDAKKFLSSLNGEDDVFGILKNCLDTTSTDCKIEFIETVDTDPTANLVILKNSKPLAKTTGYELISQVLTLTGLNHHIYFNNKERKVYNDVEIRDNQNLTFNVEAEKIWLYKKIGETYRELLVNKYRISNDKIDDAIKRNPLLSYVVDRFLKENLAENNSLISKFMKQYLADESLIDLEKLAITPFSGINYRHGICNYTGYMSPFIAAMQLIYDAVPLVSGINYAANISGTNMNLRTFENQLLNTEYCLQRIFENIQTFMSSRLTAKYDPLINEINDPSGKKENVFYNYQICVNYINNINIAINMANPINQASWGTLYPEYALENVVNNYYYKRFANNFVPGFDETTWKASVGAQTMSNNFFPGKLLLIIMETVAKFDDEGFSEQIKNEREKYLRSIATDEERRAAAYDALAKKIIEVKSGPVPADLKLGNFPAILKNECVSTIHKLIIILFKGFNVFIDFEDDLRPQEKKLEKFKDAAAPAVKEPNFVIKIASLPRSPIVEETPAVAPAPTTSTGPAAPVVSATKPGANWIKITGFDYTNSNAEYANGVYLPFNKDLYKHTEHNSIFIKYDATISNWIIFNKSDTGAEVNIAESTTLLGSSKWVFLDSLYSSTLAPKTFTTTTNPITVENIGATYLPNPGEKVDTTKTLAFTNLPDEYIITTATATAANIKYTQVGTIYKSIHHDFFYKYYNEKHQILFSDCNAIYNVNPRVLAQNTVDMFPFIRLYKKDGYDLTTVPENTVIYQDVLTWSKL
jgi:hypothetical protein